MGHIIVVFGTLIAVNLGLGYMVSDYLYEDEDKEGVVEVQEVQPETTSEPVIVAPEAPTQSE